MDTFGLDIFGHRGAAGLAPENTQAGFDLAVKLSLSWVEYDVVVTADQQAVIFHDDRIDRCSNGQGVLAEQDWHTLRQWDVGAWFAPQYSGQRILRLDALLPFLEAQGCGSNVELKKQEGVSPETLVAAAVPALSRATSPDLIVSSFDPRTLLLLHERLPAIRKAILLEQDLPNWQDWARAVNAEAVHLDDALVNPERVLACHQAGYQVRVYTVNDPVRAQQLAQWGVSGIFTDYPDRFVGSDQGQPQA